MIFIKYISIAFGLLSLSSCSSQNNATQEDIYNALNTSGPSMEIMLPPIPNSEFDSASIDGVDQNQNKIRDILEISTTKLISEKTDYEKIMNIFLIIQPSEATKIIDYKHFYCSYLTLSTDTQEKFSMKIFEEMVTDTKNRKKKFYEQVINTSGSLGAESCSLYKK